jgi:hypothetical protein
MVPVLALDPVLGILARNLLAPSIQEVVQVLQKAQVVQLAPSLMEVEAPDLTVEKTATDLQLTPAPATTVER